jgi:hypothetical protein
MRDHKLRIKPADNRRELNNFIKVPWHIYQNDPAWVPPLLLDKKLQLSPKNPYFQHARAAFWTAWRGPVPVGRISAQVDRLHLERYRDNCGFFGFLEAEDNPETFAALLKTAETWLEKQGMRQIRGPYSLSINQECGLLIEGFETPPYIMMNHARPYYASHLEKLGYRKKKDLLAYLVEPWFKPPRAMTLATRRMAGRITTRRLDTRKIGSEMELLGDIFNDAWSGNWGFLPMTPAEIKQMGEELRYLVPRRGIIFAAVDGEPAGMIVGLPNLNEAIADLNGRLLPFGWTRLLWRLKVDYPESGRVALMGIRKKFQHGTLGAALAFTLIDQVRMHFCRMGVSEVEQSWILEDNEGMRKILEAIGSRISKRYRIYGRKLGQEIQPGK